jgi:acetyl esterase/lipase
VSIGDVVPVVLIGASVLLALAPIRRPRAVAVGSFLVALGVSELPQLFAVLLLTATVPAIAQDGLLSTSTGWLLSGLALLTWVGLAVVARRALRAGGAVGRALAEGLGAEARRPQPRVRERLATLVAPIPVRPRRVVRIPDLAYGDAGRRNRLDVYRHRSRPAGAPTLVYFHGGGYFSGHKRREARRLLHRMACDGWVCISANYRLRPRAGFTDHLVDVKRVIAWVREHGPAHGADPGTVVVSGSSAGGHLAALAALTPNEPAFQPGFERADTTVSAAVCLYGYYGRYYGHEPGESPSSTPLEYDAASAPPFFLAHGECDTYVPVEGARAFAARLRRSSRQPVVYAELPGAQHAFDRFRSLRFDAVVDGIAVFLAAVCPRAGAAAEAPGRS